MPQDNSIRNGLQGKSVLANDSSIGPTVRRPTGVSVEHQVLAALRFYATCCYQAAVGGQYDLALSQPTVSRCWVQFPITPEQRHAARQSFLRAPQPFEGAIGAIDCTYVHLLAPRQHEEAYVNHWGDHALNVQAICDPELIILNINARYPGARNDAFIWASSTAKRVMERNYNRGERNTWLIGMWLSVN
ncbi:putative nuclease HARBI1 [Sitophilus oryzae]|uniref:Nuclease HARBI1 n=1 Tax=Sitophilus oryzae TaxID=7048 RepID=A0A6J2YHQ2_SITOR|nr:putative nuclease HARBI1 [Sitophilus oryzae]